MATDSAGRRFTDGIEGANTRIDAGILITGTVSGSVPVDISGTVNGKIEASALVWLRQGGTVKGDLVADSVVIEGTLEGTVKAKDKVELRSTCKVNGDVEARTVAIAEGSFFEGRIHMGGPKSANEGAVKTEARGTTSFREKREAKP